MLQNFGNLKTDKIQINSIKTKTEAVFDETLKFKFLAVAYMALRVYKTIYSKILLDLTIFVVFSRVFFDSCFNVSSRLLINLYTFAAAQPVTCWF